MKRMIWAAAAILTAVGCAHQGAEQYGPSGAGAAYLGDCEYSDICGPDYGNSFYYTPYYPLGPLSPARMRVDRVANHRTVRVVMHDGSLGLPSPGSAASSTSAGPTVSASIPQAPVSPPSPPPAVHTVAPR